MRALIIVDVQNDFVEGGSLAVRGGRSAARRIASYVDYADYHHVVTTQDWHVDPGDHWSDEPDFITTWPRHCEAGTDGAALLPEIEEVAEVHFVKGAHEAAYSGFQGHLVGTDTPLAKWLFEHGVTHVDICGIATDHCVRATALDAAALGLNTRVLLGLCAGVDEDTTERAILAMAQAGVDTAAYVRG